MHRGTPGLPGGAAPAPRAQESRMALVPRPRHAPSPRQSWAAWTGPHGLPRDRQGGTPVPCGSQQASLWPLQPETRGPQPRQALGAAPSLTQGVRPLLRPSKPLTVEPCARAPSCCGVSWAPAALSRNMFFTMLLSCPWPETPRGSGPAPSPGSASGAPPWLQSVTGPQGCVRPPWPSLTTWPF